MTQEQINKIRAEDGLPPVSQITGVNAIDRSAELQSAWGTPEVSKPLPILTNEQGGFGTALKDVSVGAGKSLLRGTRDVAGTLQGAGQRIIAGFSGTPLEEVEKTTGFKSLNNETPEGAGVEEVLKSKSRGEQVGGIIETAAEMATPLAAGRAELLLSKGKKLLTGAKESIALKNAQKEIDTIQNLISPKLTSKEVKLAESQGRLIKGKNPTLLKAGTPDEIIPSDKLIKSSQTIQREIPNASKLKEPELYTALEGRTSDMAVKLKPELQKVSIKPETVQKINTDWDSLKKLQMETAPASEEINVLKRQKKFESFLKKSGNKNMNDLWETRKSYDSSVPENVKKATINSPESLQIQKEEWLQNRKVLNDAITDLENGLGETARQPFADMTDMYSAKENLLSKAKVELTVKPSKLKQWIKDNPWKAALAGYGTGKIIESTTGINIPGI